MSVLRLVVSVIFAPQLFLQAQIATPELSASMNVNATAIVRQIPSTLYGSNIEWVWNGYGLWNEGANQADPTLVNYARQLGVSLFRYPGGMYADFYHWQQGVGPTASRPQVPFRIGDGQANRISFGTDEVIRFASSTGGELMFTVNVGTGTATEAAAWVKYCNAKGLRVKYWELGNEIYIRDGSPAQNAINMEPETYAARVVEFARAMRAVDPRIRIGAIGGENRPGYWIVGYPSWNEKVLQIAGNDIDFLAVHNAYAPVNVQNSDDLRTVYSAMLAAPALISANLKKLASQIETYAPQRAGQIGIAVTEWGPFFQSEISGRFVQHAKTLGSALFVSSLLKTFIEEPRMQIANFHTFNDLSIMCWICSTTGGFPPVWARTAEAMAFQLVREHTGTQLVNSTVNAPMYTSAQAGSVTPLAGVPYLDVLSTLSADGNTMHVVVVNKHFDATIRTTISMQGFTPLSGSAWVLGGTGLDANTGTKPLRIPGLEWATQASDTANPQFDNGGPGQVAVLQSSFSIENPLSYRFAPRSVTALQFRRAQ